VEPVAAEHLLGVLGPFPIAERIVRVRAGAHADLPALADRQRLLVLVEDLDVPAGHRTAHRALAHLDRGEVAAQRVALGQAVVVEHRDAELVPEPADHLGI
jgi:hypothetical protein